jgi:multidrug resistance efflux pump
VVPAPLRPMYVLLVPIAVGLVGSIVLARHLFLSDPVRSGRAATGLPSTKFVGRVKPAAQLTIASSGGGVIRELFVKVGDSVQAGQPLLALDDSEARTVLTQAELAYRAAQRRVEQLQLDASSLKRSLSELQIESAESSAAVTIAQRAVEEIPVRQWRDSPGRAEATWELANRSFARSRDLYDQGIMSRAELESAEAALRIATDDLKSAQEAAAAVEQLRSAQAREARARSALIRAETQQKHNEVLAALTRARSESESAAAQVDAARRRRDAATVRASSPGVISELAAAVGDQVASGAPLLRIAAIERLAVDVEISPRLVNLVRPGERAWVSLPTAPPRSVLASILSIGPIPGAEMTHTVRLEFENPTGLLLSGQPAEVAFKLR